MPRVIECRDDQATSLADCIAALETEGFDPRDEDSLIHAAKWLRRIGNDRDFLAEIMIDELKKSHGREQDVSSYGAQVVTLSPISGDFFMRANFWPGPDDHVFRASGQQAFAYELPHDHNFDFLTLGYFGPGYSSDYYEYDYEALDGVIGEKANLRFIERSALDPGKIMHYRAHLDVHSQLPPPSLSVSLNIMHSDGAQGWLDQYRFDVEKDEIAGVLGTGAAEIFLRTAVGMENAEALDVAEQFAMGHVSERMRLAALDAQAGVLDIAGRDELWRRAENAGSRLVGGEARRRRALLAQEYSGQFSGQLSP